MKWILCEETPRLAAAGGVRGTERLLWSPLSRPSSAAHYFFNQPSGLEGPSHLCCVRWKAWQVFSITDHT